MSKLDKISKAMQTVFEYYRDHWTDPALAPRLEKQRDKFKESWKRAGSQTLDTLFVRILGGAFPMVASLLPSKNKKFTAEKRGEMFGKALGGMAGGVALLAGRVLLSLGRTGHAGIRHAIGH